VTASRHIIDCIDNIEVSITKSKNREQVEAMTTMQSNLKETHKLLLEEQSHLIRIIAAVKPCNECLQVAMEERLPHTLLFLFPDPREELGEITPNSVILTPKRPGGTILLGNAARCLMPLADDTGRSATLLYDIHGISNSYNVFVPLNVSSALPASLLYTLTSEKTTVTNSQGREKMILVTYTTQPTAVHTIERLVCAMATCSDIRVRRNISILLAKGRDMCGVRDHMTKFRGMQIMLELQKQL
jgi:hypothetical protein